MFGYVAETKFGESKIWDYATVVILEEVGGRIHIHRGKVFKNNLMKLARQLTIGQQVYFETQYENRGDRVYVQYIELYPRVFSPCRTCGKAEISGECINCSHHDSERLEGTFEVIAKSSVNYDGVKLVLRKEEEDIRTTFTYIQWPNGPFKDQFEVGDIAKVIGWRTCDRITTLRCLYKMPCSSLRDMLQHE